MKKIIILTLIVALCVPTLFSCAKVKGIFGDPTKTVMSMYNASEPTKVVATTKQSFGAYELNCDYELITGQVDGSRASKYTVTEETLESMENAGATATVLPMVKRTTKETVSIEGIGSRVNGGQWNPEGSPWLIGRGAMALNLTKKLIENAEYKDNTFKFTIPQANAAEVISEDFASKIASDVDVVIVDDGAVILSIELHYFLAGDDSANLNKSEMTVKVLYSYDIENITID